MRLQQSHIDMSGPADAQVSRVRRICFAGLMNAPVDTRQLFTSAFLPGEQA